MSCACHSFNLTLCDTAHSCFKDVSFFGIVQRIYSLFANSTKDERFHFITFRTLTVKSLCNT